MAFGWSSSDILFIAKLCYDVYSFCHTAPAELQGLSRRLDRVERNLNRLLAILDKSGFEKCKEAPALEKHLLDARAYVEPLLSSTKRTTSSLTRLALKQGKLRRIEKDLDADEGEIDKIKIDLILECSLKTMRDGKELRLGLIDIGPSLGFTSETINLIDEIPPASVATSTVQPGSEDVKSKITIIAKDHSRKNDKIAQTSIPATTDRVTHVYNTPSTKNDINLHAQSKLSLSMDPKASFSCSFEIAVSEGSVLLNIIPTDGSHITPDTVVASGASVSPAESSSQRPHSRSHGTQTKSSRSFQHLIPSHNRPIPHLLHPDVEGPTEEPDAPYTITFKERQSISILEEEEHSSSSSSKRPPRRTTTTTSSPMYIFHENEDRIALCETIFGKTLLGTAGSDFIHYDGRAIAHMSAIALWLDEASGTRSITFFPNLITTSKTTATAKDVALRVHGLWDMGMHNRISRNKAKTLALVVNVAESSESCGDDDGGNGDEDLNNNNNNDTSNVSANRMPGDDRRPPSSSNDHSSGGRTSSTSSSSLFFLSNKKTSPSAATAAPSAPLNSQKNKMTKKKKEESAKGKKCVVRFTRESDRVAFLELLK